MKKVRLISVLLLSLVLMFAATTVVLAVDNETDPWATANDVNENLYNNSYNENNALNENLYSEENNNSFNQNIYDDIDDNNENNENNNSNINSTATNENDLADTGLSDSKGVIALVIVLSSIVAIYSSIKIRDYNNL